MHLYYDHTLYSFPLYTFLRELKMAHSGRNMSSSHIMNRIQDSCVLTYPHPLSISNMLIWWSTDQALNIHTASRALHKDKSNGQQTGRHVRSSLY